VALTGFVGLGCTELRARQHAREGNRLYQAGQYALAIQEYDRAQALHPDLVPVVLNKGLACRQLLAPGGQSKDDRRTVDCALEAFARLQQLRPDDPRGKQLYVQTLFEADRFEQLEAMYLENLKKDPNDRKAIHGLIQVYVRSERWQEALKWTLERARLESSDPEAHYAVGVLIHDRLFQKGGSGSNAAFDPRLGAESNQLPPQFGAEDLQGAERVRLADVGLRHIDQALAIRPEFGEAMAYKNLLHRQKAIAFWDAPERWQEQMNAAETWRQRSMAQGGANRTTPESGRGL
jgi:tetratricopeptide (TPR) repeat protein